MANIIPDSHENRLNFFKNVKDFILAHAADLGWGTPKVNGAADVFDPLIAAYQALVDAEKAVVPASAEAAQVFAAGKPDLQGLLAELKTNPGCSAGDQATLGLVTTATRPAPAAMQPRIKAAAEPGHVRVSGSKDYADLVNIYMRVVGTPAWTLVGIRRRKFPFDDQTPLKVPGTAETREYMARAVVGEDEVGLPSDIVSVTFGG